MKKINNFAPHKASANSFAPLPVAPYVCKIMKCEEQSNQYGSQLVISFDICEGEYANYYSEKYKNSTFADKKWGGVLYLSVPSDKSRYPESDQKNIENLIACVEEENPKFSWDWDETKLKGCVVGINYCNKEWEYNGQTGWSASPRFICSAQDVRDGKVKQAKDRPLTNKTTAQTNSYSVANDDYDDLPF